MRQNMKTYDFVKGNSVCTNEETFCFMTSILKNEDRCIPVLKFLFQAPFTAHEGSHFLNALQGERRLAQGPQGNAHELHGIIVRCHPVGA